MDVNKFEKVADATAVIVTRKGVRYPLDIYTFDTEVYVPWQGGFVRITTPDNMRSRKDGSTAFRTDHPDLWVSHVIGKGVTVTRDRRIDNGQSYLRPTAELQRVA